MQLADQGLDLIKHNMIWQEQDRYHVFGKYEIDPCKNGYQVWCPRQEPRLFSSAKTALAWCIADKYQRHDIAQEIHNLDHRREQEQRDIAVRLHMARQTRDADRRDIAMLKVEHRKQKLTYLQARLDKCVNLAKYWQIRGFQNETVRTGRTASTRKNSTGL